MAKSAIGLVLVTVATLLCFARAQAAGLATQDTVACDWPSWRGPNHDGVAPSSPKLMDKWPKEGPKQLWRSDYIPSGPAGGWGSCVVADGKVFAHFIANTPKDTARGFRPITAELLAEWGWCEDMPADLVKKIEDERKKPEWIQISRKNNKAEMAEYAKKFTAGLDPKPPEKFADVISRRLTNLDAHGESSESGWSWGSNYSWAGLEQLTKLKDKEFKSSREFAMTYEKIGVLRDAFYQWARPFGAAFGKVADSGDAVVCLDANTGKELWRALIPQGKNPAPRGAYCIGATPAAGNGKVFVSGEFFFYCVSAKDGAVLWKQPLTSFSHCSPLVMNNTVICNVNGPLTAFDGETGKVLWQQHKAGDNSSSPVLWTHQGKTYVIHAGYNPCCIDPLTGKILWQEEHYHGDAGTPVISGDYLLLGMYDKKLFRISPEKAEFLWNKTGQFGDHVGSPLIYKDLIFDTGGVGRCLDLKTGEVKWSDRTHLSCDYGTPCIVDEKAIAYPQNIPNGQGFGHVVMYRPTAEKFELLGAFKPKFQNLIPGEKGDWAHIMDMNYVTSPTVANGRLFVRMSDSLFCYDLTEAGNR
jgi:outer membrane protein assembly factor BamB